MRALARLSLLGAALSLVVPLASRAEAQSCAELSEWAEGCVAACDLQVAVSFCAPNGGLATLEVKRGEDPSLFVEIRKGGAPALARVGPFHVGPRENVPDWSQEPLAKRETFEALLTCLRLAPLDEESWTQHDPSLLAPKEEPIPFPWLLLGGLACFALVLRSRLGLLVGAGSSRWKLPLALLGMGAITLAFRGLAFPWAFFHQNGQGPLWVSYGLNMPSGYGPGMGELYAALLNLAPWEPSHHIFALNAIGAACIPPLIWLLARSCGARPLLAWGLALALAIQPSFARIGQSESYFAPCATLLFIAATLLAMASLRPRVRDPILWIGCLGAGLLIAQAARIHPMAWLPGALIPLVVALGGGRSTRRLKFTALAGLGTGLVALLFAGGVLLEVSVSRTGASWLEKLGTQIDHGVPMHWVLIGLTALAISWRRPRALRASIAIVLVVLVATHTDLLGSGLPLIRDGFYLLHAPVAFAGLAALPIGLRRPRQLSWMLLALSLWIGALFFAARLERARTLPTDVLEQLLWTEAAAQLPPEAELSYVGAVGRRVLTLPLYPDWRRRSITERSLRDSLRDNSWTLRPLLDEEAYYYRGSACATPDGRPQCDALESATPLEEIWRRALPARESMPGLGYDTSRVEVTLYRVVRRP